MPLSPVQKGAVGQLAFLIAALVTGKGQVEAYTPAIDNEGRDAEVRRHLKSLPAIGLQIKIAFSVRVRAGHAPVLLVRFRLPAKRVQNDPRLWYFFAYFDSKQLRFDDIGFLIPAHVFHTMGRRGKRKGDIFFELQASLDPRSQDRWSSYRVAIWELGNHLLKIIDDGALTASAASADLPADSTWVFRPKAPAARKSLSKASDRAYALIRGAVLEHNSIEAWYQGRRRLFSPFLLGTKAGEEHVLGYQFGGSSEKPLVPDGSPQNWRCLRVSQLTRVKVIRDTWHSVPMGKGYQHCIDQIDVSAYRPSAARRRLRPAA